MAQIALPRQQVTQASQSPAVGSPLYERRRTSNGPFELIPNPDFSFPQQGPGESTSEPASAGNARPMSLQAYPTGRRGSTPGARQKSVSALPDFSFNPAATTSQPSTSAATPPHSPTATPTTPSRPIGGHRRGGSEFIGGDRRGGGTSLMSSSPTKSEGVLPPPNPNLRPGPPAGRRGHAHRRSGAISSHDLSAIMRPAESNNAPRAGSAPVTPLEGEQFVFGHSVNKSLSQPSLRSEGFFPDDPNSSPRRPPSRARVGFSDKVEYIRPLSTISSETETSLSTMRGHSATGSLSSVISAGTSSPNSARMGRPSLNISMEIEGRPSTAGAVLDMSRPKDTQDGGDPFNRKRPMSAVSPGSPTAIISPASSQISTKRRSFFRLESRRSDPTVPTLATSASDPALSAPLASPLPSPQIEDGKNLDGTGKRKSTSRKGSRKPRKVKSWANSIISRKGKHSGKSKRRAPTPPPETAPDSDYTSESEDLDFEANFDVDNTVTIVSPTEDANPPRKLQTDFTSWQPRQLNRVDSDTMSPTIDLDAALGPFNTPHGSSPQGPRRGFAAHRRAMHSAGGMLQNHRRTESAPELVPFELRTAAVGTTPAMADVFEEDEPEEEATGSSKSPSTPASVTEEEEEEEPKIQVVESEQNQNGSKINWNFGDGLRIKQDHKTRAGDSQDQLAPLDVPKASTEDSSKQSLDVSPVEVVEDYEEPRTSSLTHSSDSTVTPQMSEHETKEPPPVMNLSLPLPQQSLMTPDTFTSSFSSPDFRSSQASLDTPRLGTAASSVTDYRAMPSPRFGEPGPELRISVDDVPSLTSSRSTMTSAMHNTFTMMSPRRPGERSSSLCSVPSDIEHRRRKRSSIASLSRLINGSSFGEKSKLSIEQRPHSEYLEPTNKESKKKHRRLSKLMQFWKPKESSRA